MQKIGVTVLACLSMVSCGWREKMTFQSPDGSTRLVIKEPALLGSSGVKVVLTRGSGETTVHEQRGDMFLWLAEVAWTPDGQHVGVFSCAEPYLQLAINRETLSKESFSLVEAQLRRQLRERYGLGADVVDEFRWTCLHAGTLKQ
jgi:hypothetical protein